MCLWNAVSLEKNKPHLLSFLSISLSLPNVINPYRSQLRLYISHIQLSLSLIPLLLLFLTAQISKQLSLYFSPSQNLVKNHNIRFTLPSVYPIFFCFPWFGVRRNGIKEVRRRKGSLQPSFFCNVLQ